LDFLDHVLPGAGLRCVAVPSTRGGFKHFFYTDNAHAAQVIEHLDTQRGLNVYFGCSSFLTPDSRKQSNVAAVRSFWADIDCGEGKPYASAKEGLVALKNFLEISGLPTPTVVSSGRGLHCYWVMDADMDRATWKPAAIHLKQAFEIAGLDADPSRTADEASVLRPVGSHHRKGEPREVVLFKYSLPCSLNIFHSQVLAFLEANAVAPEVVRDRATHAPGINDEYATPQEYPPTYAEKIANRCAQVAAMRDTQGDVSYEHWRGVIGLIRYCEEGLPLAEAWSARREETGHSQTDTAQKFDTWTSPPTTCSFFAKVNPGGCEGCAFKDEIASPIRLGMEVEPITVQTETPETPAQQVVQSVLGFAAAPPPRVVDLPDGYQFAQFMGKPSLQVAHRDKDGDVVWVPFCDTLFYPVNRLQGGEDEGYALEMEMRVRVDANGQSTVPNRRFILACGIIAEGGKGLAAALGKQEIVPRNPKLKGEMDAYLQAWIDKLRNEADEIAMHKNFGWHGDNFLIGNTLIEPGGARIVTLRGIAAQKSRALEPKGDLNVWVDTIDRAYNRPGQEHFQFQVTLGFAAPLFSLFGEYGGVTVYAHSQGTGKGKTTAQRCALSAWGDWRALQLADGKATVNALWALIGCYSNLPVMFDELTNQTNAAASEIVFSVSSGRQKERLSSDGSLRNNNSNWSTILMASGNNLLSEKLSQHRANAEAEMARAFEITVPDGSPLSVDDANALFPRLVDNYGHAGVKFMSYVVANREGVRQVLAAVQQQVNSLAGVTQGERYWSAMIASCLTALYVCRKLDLLRFDPVALRMYLIDRLTENRAQRDSSINPPLEVFGRMLADLWPGILVTVGQGDLRTNKAAMVKVHPKGPMVGRVVMAHESNERSTLLLNVAAMKAWCNKNSASTKEMLSAAEAAGWASPDPIRYSLGSGTSEYAHTSSQVRCVHINLAKMAAEGGHPGVTTRLTMLDGGLTAEAKHAV
jgi:hypothetical protein